MQTLKDGVSRHIHTMDTLTIIFGVYLWACLWQDGPSSSERGAALKHLHTLSGHSRRAALQSH